MVCRENKQRAGADGVALVAEDGRLVRGVPGDAAAVLLILGVPEEHGARDLVVDGGGGLGEGITYDGAALAVWRIAGQWETQKGEEVWVTNL